MGDSPESPKLTAYGPDRFAEHLPFGRTGYLFTVPGNFPAELPQFCRDGDCEMAVYSTRASGAQMWEVRDVGGRRRVWGEAHTRRDAVGMALLEITRKRRESAEEIRERRVNVLGLEPEPPYRIEKNSGADLVLNPATGRASLVAADPVSLRTRVVGLLHDRCACPASDLVGFRENRKDAAAYLTEECDAWWACTGPEA
ncbi:hypothetical protein [Streptomyces sp. NPDC059916]|uniref:hypothetical protein n=1 Tax=Streptomyces sp. NPDC059916 TaxID=3347001 RepID=UPI0036C1F161